MQNDLTLQSDKPTFQTILVWRDFWKKYKNSGFSIFYLLAIHQALIFRRRPLSFSADFTAYAQSGYDNDAVPEHVDPRHFLVRVNHASKKELATLPDVGDRIAEYIIQARKNGRIESVADLYTRVKALVKKGCPYNPEKAESMLPFVTFH